MSEPTSHQPPSEFRENLRRAMRARREALHADEHAQSSLAIERHLTRLITEIEPRVVGFCWPWAGEFDARGLIEQWLTQNTQRRAVLPVIEADSQPMKFREWAPSSPMADGRYGIKIPAEGAWVHPELFLMPVLAVDARGYRLGYGGGYFDRTWAVLHPRPLAVGVAFEWQRVESIAPQPWDEQLDYVVSEAGITQTRPTLRTAPNC